MANTTRKKKNTSSRSRGSGSRSRARKGGSSSGNWVVYSLLFAVLCGGGYYVYENGLPFDIEQFKWESPEKVMSQAESKEEPQKVVAKKVRKEKQEPVKEKKETQQPAAEKAPQKAPAQEPAEQKTTATKQKVKQKETSKFVAPSYKTYHQGRWGYTVVYPSFLTQEIRSENNDGCHFADYEGTEFMTYGSWNVGEATIKELYREKLDDNMKVTYKRLYKEENYFIKFGYTKDGRMFYMKQVIADQLKEAPVITGILYFRPESKKGSEAVIKKIFDKFPY